MLRPSILSSSSDLPFSTLLRECRAVAKGCKFELSLLRERDIQEIPGLDTGGGTLAEVLSDRRKVDVVADWVECQLNVAGISEEEPIAAIATYFPGISSFACGSGMGTPSQRRALAISALANAVRIGLALKARNLMRTVVVEAVCGTILDECKCDECRARELQVWKDQHREIDVIVEFDRHAKYRVLLDSLVRVAENVATDSVCNEEWAIALELEPGATYVLNDGQALKQVFDLVHKDVAFGGLQGKVGFNIDIGHLKIARVDPDVLEYIASDILHSHTCDNPRMHTRDQAVGEWHPVELRNSVDYEYLEVLEEVCVNGGHPLFTKCVSLELEGCSRFRWIYTALAAMEYQLRMLRSSPKRTGAVPQPHFPPSGGSSATAIKIE